MPDRHERNSMRQLIILFVLCASALPMSAGEPKPAAGLDIAVLRLNEVIQNSKLYLGRIDQLKKDQAETQAHLKQMEEQLQALENKLQVLSPTSDKFAQAQEEFEMVKVKRELLAKRVRALLDRRHGALLKETYDVLRGHLRDFAKERGLKLVTLAPNQELPNAGSNEIQMQLGLQVALYYDASLDITEPFIAFLNSRYAGEAPAAAPAAPATPAGP
jgi:Skp family chaperone for outer membrane proteins